jgi:hypothetical protein
MHFAHSIAEVFFAHNYEVFHPYKRKQREWVVHNKEVLSKPKIIGCTLFESNIATHQHDSEEQIIQYEKSGVNGMDGYTCCTIASSTLVILFSKMLEFSYIYIYIWKIICEGK